MKTILLFGSFLLFYSKCYCQSYDNNWVFGDSAGLSFVTGATVSISTVITSFESSASISDSLGNLLFYTNGERVWNKLNDVMPNGDSLNIGGTTLGYPSSNTQGVIILPNPGNINQYFLINSFSIDRYPMEDSFGLSYSTIDIDLNGGLGDITIKNIPFYIGPLWEKMQAVKHANGRDWWLMVHSDPFLDNADCFIRFLISPDTFSEPLAQCFDLVDSISLFDGNMGQMKFSQDGSKLVFTRGQYFNIYDFDRCSGELSNNILVKGLTSGFFYGCELSSDNRRLYLTNIDWGVNESKIYQFCLECPESIIDSKRIIYKNEFENYSFSQLQIGPDGKIYAPLGYIYYTDFVNSEINGNICVINNPEGEGLACNFDTLTIPLEYGRSTYNLPNMPNYNLGALEGSPCDTLVAINNDYIEDISVMIYPNPAEDFIRLELAKTEIIKSIKTINYLGEEIELAFDENLKARVTNIVPGFYITVIVTEKDRISINWEKL